MLNEKAAKDGHLVTISFTRFFITVRFHIQSSVLITLLSLQSPASLNELKTLVEKKRRLKVGKENFWGMVLIKQMPDIISCEIWNVFCRQAFACIARGRDTVRAVAPPRFCKSGIKMRCARDTAPSQVCTRFRTARFRLNTPGSHPLLLLTGAALRMKSQTHLNNTQALSFHLKENTTCPVQPNHLKLFAKVMYLKKS